MHWQKSPSSPVAGVIMIKQQGYAFPEVLIASAVFSVGVLALAKLSITTETNLLVLQQIASHKEQTQLLSLKLGSLPMTRQSLLVHVNEVEGATALLSDENNHQRLAAPLYKAEVQIRAENGTTAIQPIVTGYPLIGSWQDVVP